MADILAARAATCMAVSTKVSQACGRVRGVCLTTSHFFLPNPRPRRSAFNLQFLVLGTDYGTLHILDSINGTEAKMFQQVSECPSERFA